MPLSISTDSGLLSRVQSNDHQAWRDFVDLYGPLIYSWCRRRGLSDDDSADLTQECLVSVVSNVAAFDHAAGQGSLRGWLWTITSNKVRDMFRKLPPGGQGAGGFEQPYLDELADLPLSNNTGSSSSGEIRGLLHRALEQLRGEFEDRTWQAFSLVVFQDRDTASVAAELGMTANHVRQAKSRVLRRLRERLSDFRD